MNDFIILTTHPDYEVKVVLRHVAFEHYFFGLWTFQDKRPEYGDRESFIFVTSLDKAKITAEFIQKKYNFKVEIKSFSKTFPELFQKYRRMQIQQNDKNAQQK